MRAPGLLLTAAALALPMPALAQHVGHGQPAHGEQASLPADTPHAGHAQAPPDPAADPHAVHADAPESTRNGGRRAASAALPPVGPPPPEAFSGPEHAADALFGEAAMARARRDLARTHGAVPAYRVLVDRFEARLQEGADTYLLDAQAWYGGDIDKLWLKAEGEGGFEEGFEEAELQALWSHAIGPWFDLQAGARLDLREGADRTHLVLGAQGLAPYWIEVDAAAFLSDRGDLTARVEAAHDARIAQKLILQPRAELQISLQDIPAEITGAGLTSAAAGARLRYQMTPLLGPYVGLEYARTFGDTRDMRRAANEDLGGLSFVAGLRAWF